MADEGNGAGVDGIDPSALASVLRARAARDGISVQVEGSSMGHSISGGGEVRVLVSRNPRRGEIWCYVDDRGTPVVHRVRAVRDQMVVFRGDANRSDDHPVPLDRLVGRVVGTESGLGFGRRDRWRSVTHQAAYGIVRRLGRVVRRRRSPGPPG